MNTTSYWSDTAALPRFHKVDQDYKVDVAIIGAGITGVTSAYLLKQAGFKVALVERGRCGGFDTSNTTAHLTCVTDTRMHTLVSKFGRETARAVWESARAAVDQIFNLIQAEEIECDFHWNPAFLYAAASDAKEKASLRKDARLASELGFPAQFLESVPLAKRPGVKFFHQARFHPLRYLAALVKAVPGKGSHVFENSEVEEVQEKPLLLKIGNYKIRCSHLILATHTPLTGKTNIASATLFQSKLFLYTTYAIGAKIPTGAAPYASYWDTAEPYHYLRIDPRRGFDYAIFGGEDHKTGQVKKTLLSYDSLEQKLKKLIPRAVVDHHWSGQVIETPDGLPYIGETAERQFAGTGFSGNGMTFGTLTAMMAVDSICGRKNPWKQLYDPRRKSVSGTWHYVRENLDYPYYMLRDWLGRGETKSLKGLHRSQGKIVRLNGKKVAAYRDPHGKVSLLSPVCTHLQCIVGWNQAEKTWDCPCHGSRFAATGEVLAGPAEEPLEPVDSKTSD